MFENTILDLAGLFYVVGSAVGRLEVGLEGFLSALPTPCEDMPQR
jgi:hypothetical protein